MNEGDASIKKTIIITLMLSVAVCSTVFAQDNTDYRLHQAVKKGDFEKVKSLISENTNLINSKDYKEYTPLVWAAFRKEWDILKYLINEGADINLAANDRSTPLHAAVIHDNPDIVKYLFKKGADLKAVTQQGWPPLHNVYISAHPEVVKLIITLGAPEDFKDNDNKIPADYKRERSKPVKIEETILPDYSGSYNFGKYETGEKVIFRAYVKNGTLWLEESANHELYPVGEDRFYCRNNPWMVVFNRNKEGEVVQMDLHFTLATIKGKKEPEENK